MENAIQNIRDITAKLHEVVIDEKERENVLNSYTEQEFRVIHISLLMLIYKKVILVIEVGIATLIIVYIPHDRQSIVSCLSLTLPILLSKILVKIQALM